MLKSVVVAAAAAAVVATGAAAAREADSRQPVSQRPRRTILHFGEDDIRGDITRPDGELVQAPRKVADPSMLRVRRSFVDRALSVPLQGR